MLRFVDRTDAGRALAARLLDYADRPDLLVLALPRGGAPVGYEVAQALHAPLDVFLVRKLGVPGHEELAMGAIASGGIRVLNRDVVREIGIPPSMIDHVAAQERAELDRRDREYRDGRPPPDVRDKTVILVDDGLATGATMRAALVALRAERPKRLIAAVPVAPASTCQSLRSLADEMICLKTPEPFYGVGMWYEDFAPTSDAEVRELLARNAAQTGAATGAARAPYPPREFRQGGSSMQTDPENQEQMATTPEEQRSRAAPRTERNESGMPGGGVGRADEVGRTGVYPLSADEGASPDAMVEPEAAFGQGERGAAGYQDSGESEIIPPDALGKTGDEII